MGERRAARIVAFQTLYRYDLSRAPLPELLDFSWLDDTHARSLGANGGEFARLLVAGAVDNLDRIDAEISAQLEHWDFERIHRVDRAILRLSSYCLLFQEQSIPPSVTIDEAVEIAREFGGDDSPRFVNGVLDGLRRRVLPAT